MYCPTRCVTTPFAESLGQSDGVPIPGLGLKRPCVPLLALFWNLTLLHEQAQASRLEDETCGDSQLAKALLDQPVLS